MAIYNIEKELKKLDNANAEMAPLVRERLNDTYDRIAKESKRAERPRAGRKRRATAVAAAAGILGVGLFASAFISPAMAGTIKNIPVLGSLFSSIQSDIGLRAAGELGLTERVGAVTSYEDVKLEVSEAIYDGSRAAFLLTVQAPNLEQGIYSNGKKTMKLSDAFEQISFKVDDETPDVSNEFVGGGIFYGGAGEAHPNTLVFEQVLDSGAPDAFDAAVTFKLDGIDHEFTLEVPFRQTTGEGIELSPNLAVSSDDLTFTLSEVNVTPVTTRLKTSIAMDGKDALTTKEERRLLKIGVAVYDDQGRRLPALNGEGIIEGNRLVYDRLYATTPGAGEYLVVKPFVIEDDFAEDVKANQFLEGLETKVELK